MTRAVIIALREVPIIVAGLIALIALGAGMQWYWLAGGAGLLLLLVGNFFRDPDRTPENAGANGLLAPADGRIRKIDEVDEPLFIGGKALRISIFLSVLDVHVQRSPCAGEVRALHYVPGRFVPAFSPAADENESNLVGLQTAHGPIAVTQMTGILARRIVCWSKVGDALLSGERFGLIKFGSRVDLYLPLDAQALVAVGRQVYGGQTVVARLPAAPQ